VSAPEQQLPSAGWYVDPQDELGQRYWDGARWTEDRRKEQAESLERLARWVLWSLALAVVALAALFAFVIPHLINVNEALDGQLSPAELAESRDRTDTAGLIVDLVGVVPALLLFLVWNYRSYRNLPRLGATGLKHRSWAVVPYWFIPVVSLLLPKHVMNDVWRASDPELPVAQGAKWKDRAIPAVLGWWWGFVVAYQLATSRAFSLDVTGNGLEDERNEMIFSIAYAALGIVAFGLTAIVVQRVTERQEQRRQLFTTGDFPVAR